MTNKAGSRQKTHHQKNQSHETPHPQQMSPCSLGTHQVFFSQLFLKGLATSPSQSKATVPGRSKEAKRAASPKEVSR
ncbi:hypothetical protein CLU79DRAFT_767691 [Phycomyces nitens]|nr:hypothetical protein CLU79DRAFT_767691 [Phycomyces nitens]